MKTGAKDFGGAILATLITTIFIVTTVRLIILLLPNEKQVCILLLCQLAKQ